MELFNCRHCGATHEVSVEQVKKVAEKVVKDKLSTLTAELERYKRAFKLLCADMATYTGSCEHDRTGKEPGYCSAEVCNGNKDGECYIKEYFLRADKEIEDES